MTLRASRPRSPHRRRVHQLVLGLGSVVLAALVLATAALGAAGTTAAKPKLTTLVLGVSGKAPGGNMLQLPIAQAQGYFSQEGLKIKPVFLGTSGAVMQAMAAGKVDIGMSTPDVVLEAIQHGQKVKMFYNWTTRTVAKFAVLPDSPITKVADLKGKTIGVQALSSGPTQLARASLAGAGVDPDKDVQYVAVGTGAPALDALQRGRVDALILYDTLYAAMTAGTGTTLRFVEPAGVQDLFSSSMVAPTKWLEHNGRLAAGFGRAWAKASVFALANPQAGIRALFEYYPSTKVGSSEEDAAASVMAQFEARMQSLYGGKIPKHEKWGAYPISGVSHWISFALQNELIPKWISPIYVYTNQFVSKYNDFSVAAVEKEAKAAH